MIIGYARVSTNGQEVADQLTALETAGCVKVYREKLSGARSNRPQLAKALAALDEGDLLLMTRLDRLARSTDLLFNRALGSCRLVTNLEFLSWTKHRYPHSPDTSYAMCEILRHGCAARN